VQPQYNNMDPYSQTVQYPNAQTGGQAYQPPINYPNPTPPPFNHSNGSGFVNPYTMFNGPQLSLSYAQYAPPMPSTSSGFTYEQAMFLSTPMSMPMTPSDAFFDSYV
jgi:hypothetical protein